MRRRFFTLDVFTAIRFAGNPLAVVLDAGGLDLAAMQAIAGEFNLSETVFVLPPEQVAHRARLRIFTPKRELPFAGHPTVGTAVLLVCLDGADTRGMVLEENIGPVACEVTPAKGGAGASFVLPSLPAEAGASPGAAALAEALGLAVHDIGCGPFQPGCWSAGNPFVMVPLKSLDAIGRAKPGAAFAPTFGQRGAFVFTNGINGEHRGYRARMFAPHLGVAEDPATGSAVAAFAGMLARFAGLGDGDHAVVIEQGYEMGRPSLINLRLTLRGGALTAASIGGDAVIVTEGVIEA